MKTVYLRHIILLLTLALLLPNASAQDYVKQGLPAGVKMRLGDGVVNEIQFSPDGTRLALASTIGIWIYDTSTGKKLNLLTGHTDVVRSVSFSPDGKTLASGSDDKTVRLWDTATGKHLRTLTGHTEFVLSVSFSPDGMTLATGGLDGTILLWDMSLVE